MGREVVRVQVSPCAPDFAGIAQLVERNLAKVEVAGSIPVSRSKLVMRCGALQAGR